MSIGVFSLRRVPAWFAVAVAMCLVSCVSSGLTGTEHGTENPVTVITDSRPDGVDMHVHNKTAGSVTVEIWFTRLENAAADRRLPAVLVVGPRERVRALTLGQRDRARRWDFYFMYSYRHGSMQAKPDGTVYALPFRGETARHVGQGYHGSFSHHGEHAYSLDFLMPIGTAVTAARDGVVVLAVDRFDGYGTTPEYLERSNRVLVEHADGTIGNYEHFRKGGVRVRPGQRVRTGEVLGEVGLVGYTTPHPHLHFNVFVAVDAKRIRTVPVLFRTADGEAVRIVEGRSYR